MCIVPDLGIEYNAPWDIFIPWGVGTTTRNMFELSIDPSYRSQLVFDVIEEHHLTSVHLLYALDNPGNLPWATTGDR